MRFSLKKTICFAFLFVFARDVSYAAGNIKETKIRDWAILSASTPDKVQTKAGEINFKDGVPDINSLQALRNEIDHINAVNAYINSFGAVSRFALRKGLRDAGVNDNEALVFSKLMDSNSIFLTANADTYCVFSYLDLSKGPVVLGVPHNVSGALDDMWSNWITDVGVPGPDRGEGGNYLIVPPGYEGPLPSEGYFVRHSKTNGVLLILRAFIDREPIDKVDARVKAGMKIYPYVHGGYGTSLARFLSGKSTLGQIQKPLAPKFHEGSGLSVNTVPPGDYSFYEMLNEAVQSEPAEALDPELAGQFYAIGIEKGKFFNPDADMKQVLTLAAATANAICRLYQFYPRDNESYRYYGGESHWTNALFSGGHDFMTPSPQITADGFARYPNDGAKKIAARNITLFSYAGTTPAMCMRLPNAGSLHLASFFDAKGEPFDGSKTYKIVIPANIPAERFWSLTLYDNQTRSMLATPQKFPRAGSQKYPTPAAEREKDGTTVIYTGPKKPSYAKKGNWIQTDPKKGWFVLFRLYGAEQPFFDKSWVMAEFEEVKTE